MVALRASLARAFARANQALIGVWDATGGSAVPANSCDLRSIRNIALASLQHCCGGAKAPQSAGYCFASGAASTALQAAGSDAIVIGGFGFGGVFGGFGWRTESLNQ